MIKPIDFLFTIVTEHIDISHLTGKYVKDVKESTISDHLWQSFYLNDFDYFDILVSSNSKTSFECSNQVALFETSRLSKICIKLFCLYHQDRMFHHFTVSSFQ